MPDGLTKLDRGQEIGFQSWYKKIADIMGLNPNPDPILHQYDYRGFYKEFAMDNREQSLKDFRELHEGNPEAHGFVDKYKLPFHPTFSNESIYQDSTKGIIGGSWDGEVFIPSKWNEFTLNRKEPFVR